MAAKALADRRGQTDEQNCAGSPPGSTEALAASALSSLTRAIAVISSQGSVLFRNPAFDALLGVRDVARISDFITSGSSRTGAREFTLDDGRVVQIETTPMQEGLLVVVEDVSHHLAERRRAAECADVDALTQLANRAGLRRKLTELVATTHRPTEAAAVLTIDLDRFKVINDSLGHAIGDALLRLVADRLRSTLGPDDVAARFGADEFGVIQVGRPQPQSAAALAQRLVDLLGRSYLLDGHLINVGASVGVALAHHDGTDCDTLLANADLALYRAKQDGGAIYRFFESAMNKQMEARRSLEIDLRRALALRELALAYQPQVSLASGRIIGFEALLRWQNPKRGHVSPAEFIPLAEEIGLIVPIGEWVIRTACREAAGWPRHLGVAVNVSAVQFRSPNLVATILSALAESGLEPGRLELEITESVLLRDHATALDVLHKMRALGVRVAMDDFGTGYSSLSYLRSFPFNKIKIDQSFVRGETSDASGMAIVDAIAALGRSLGMTTTAEGVETAEQLARISTCGCTDAQGYLISRPLTPEQVRDFLQAQPGIAVAAPPQ